MSKDIPEIDDLTRGINDSELILTEDSARAQIAETECNESDEVRNTKTSAVSLSDTGCWGDFMEYLQSDDSKTDKTERLVCKLDRDLADSLDDCDIHGRCRSDLVNAIVRAFFKSYLPRLAEYRREKKSLFNSYNL